MINYQPLFDIMQSHEPLAVWAEQLPAQLEERFADYLHGNLQNWLETIDNLPKLAADKVDLNTGLISVSSETPLSPEQQHTLKQQLLTLSPWRKGPYNLHGVHIETEWRSDWKWDRLEPHIAPLKGRKVLDIGCGSGYHCWRMAGAGAELVIGLDPSQLFLAQFLTVKHFFGKQWPVHFIPLGVEAIPAELSAFDTVFSMGVLYHRRSPIDHLLELKGALSPGGELVLDTLIIDGAEGESLVPKGRYSKMRNVWFIPTAATLVGWMERCGYTNVRVVDTNVTTTEEQHATEWMTFESLNDYLDPNDSTKTVEGYPAPKRAVVIANRP
ncbi:MAG: tRNA 5-methoxyuridine(34)/uridine 5-oxyacetic acid(34) synthase CmoB [Chromatiales bacterium]|nr:tRNA 5-methoxyuridine(34)/uridine 5-oxyacetic acid(34) synthase CmoB [Chromatiales bacterium]